MRRPLLAILAALALTGCARTVPQHVVTAGGHEAAFPAAVQPDLDAPLRWRATIDDNARVLWWTTIATRPASLAQRPAQPSRPAGRPTVPNHTPVTTGRGSHRGYATAKECVMWVENGGDYGRSSNPNHFGREQWSRPTWAAYGGNPATWGHASASEQDEVFERAWNSPGGPSNWLPYDGC